MLAAGQGKAAPTHPPDLVGVRISRLYGMAAPAMIAAVIQAGSRSPSGTAGVHEYALFTLTDTLAVTTLSLQLWTLGIVRQPQHRAADYNIPCPPD